MSILDESRIRMDTKNRVTVTIMGEEYILRGSSSPEEIARVGYYVDRVMKKLADSNNHMSSHKVAVLAALNIADELLRFKNNNQPNSANFKGQVE